MYNYGILFLFLYNLITSAKNVYVSSLLQHLPPFLVLTLSFLIVSLFFAVMIMSKGALASTWRVILKSKQNAIFLCISTLFGWVSFYFALKLIEPAIVTGITSASGPLITRLFFRPESSSQEEGNHKRFDEIVSCLIFLMMIYLVCQTLLGQSAVGKVTLASAVTGFASAFICGFANVTNTIFSKRLNAAGLGSMQILSFRFIPLVGLAALAQTFAVGGFSVGSADLVKITIMALVGITLPVFLFQEGIRRSSAMIVAYVHATIPVFVLLIQFFDPRLTVTAYSIGGVIGISCLSLASILIKNAPSFSKSVTTIRKSV